jgi:excisionase family DNA binding protein
MVWGMATHITPSHLTSAPTVDACERAADPNGPPRPSPSTRLLAAEEVADLLGVPRSFVYSLARRGGIPTVRLGDRYVRFRPDAISDWITDQEQTTRRWPR